MNIAIIYGMLMSAFGFLLGALFMWLWDRTGNVSGTQGAAYDAMEEPTTEYDVEAVRKLLNSW